MRNKVICNQVLTANESGHKLLHPSDYCRVVTTINSYSNILVDSRKWKCVHSLQDNSCYSNTVSLDSQKCNAIHYGLCLPVVSSKEVITVKSSENCEDDGKHYIFLSEKHSSDSETEPELDFEIKTATTKTTQCSNTSPSKPSSPTLSDCAAIQLLAEDVEGKLENLLKTFVYEEKLRQEAKLNLLNNKRSSSLSSINSESSSVSSSPTTSPESLSFTVARKSGQSNGPTAKSHVRSMSPLKRSSGTSSFTRERTISPSRQRQRSVSPTKDAFVGGTANGAQKSTSLGSSDTATATKQNDECAKNKDKNISPIKSEKNISSSKSSQSSTKISVRHENSDSPRNKMVFGLSEKTPKTKYMQIATERQSPATTVTPLKTNKSRHCSSNDPSTVAAVNSILKTSAKPSKTKAEKNKCVASEQRFDGSTKSDDCNKTMEEILAEALQLTDDEKSSLLFARSMNKDKNENNVDATVTPEIESEMRTQDYDNSNDSSKDQKYNNDYNFSSPVDYAKSRFITISKVKANSNNYVNKVAEKPTQSLVNEARQKWENNEFANCSTSSKKFIRTHNFNLHFTEREDAGVQELQNGHLYTPSHHLLRHNPITPFLTKGSVAERVLLYEKRPEIARDTLNTETEFSATKGVKRSKSATLFSTWRTNFGNENEVANIARNFGGRKLSINRGLGIPRFYYPNGRPLTTAEIESQVRLISAEFAKFENGTAKRSDFSRLAKVCGLPLYWKYPLYLAVSGNGNDKGVAITCDVFVEFWKKLLIASFDEASKFVKILTKAKRNYLIPDDFVPMLQDVVDTHPGLQFLKEAIEFHSRYINTVIARIYYCVNQSWSGRITVPELRKSNFLAVVRLLEEEEDINQITDYFSYEHFYVIYCKFWELDKDHDLIIDKIDLSRHNDGAISSRMINRIFSGAVTRGPVCKQSKMTYSEFVWFLLSEEDKKQPRSIEYWFRCMDIDGDGFLSMYELEYFYAEQIRRMEAIGIEPLPFTDCLCQMLDMIKPKIACKISLADLKKCRLSYVFFDTFFNLDKYLEYEQRDPFANKEQEDLMVSDWDRFAAEEYEILVAEENAHNHNATKYITNCYRQLFSSTLTPKMYGLSAFAACVDDEDDDYCDSEVDYAL